MFKQVKTNERQFKYFKVYMGNKSPVSGMRQAVGKTVKNKRQSKLRNRSLRHRYHRSGDCDSHG